ncbi:c-type cytochrome biogenesis protein CcsB [Kibdelosporangium aridum]|uniref:C-type cytochrome biogenesis protein CcsB n=1 Tax=Kibdelosporangium aridum TaxID=2030 RepID=A0A428YWK2_KIBAR|nr:c-type cytochrome biogenesis protein CcsB [Kibdelosporangium aridum]RSM74328.1 c-type cytochrome biogenesis protein CcsB [Kibdelosporangium aridum]
MMVNETLAQFGDWTYGATVVVYIFAMALALIEQAFGRVRPKRAAARQLATVGGPSITEEPPAQAIGARPKQDRAERFGRMGAALMVLGALLHFSSLVLRGLAVGCVPWGNMYEYMSAVSLVAVVTWLVLMKKFPVRRLSAFVLLPIVILMFLGGTVLYSEAAPLQPALRSYWLIVHVAAAIIASGLFLVPGVASILYLIRNRYDHDQTKFVRLGERLPGADVLDRVAYRTTIIAFPIFTFGVICGGIWAEAAWGRFWGWDPKETVAFVAWVIYAAYLHSRATAGWRGGKAAWINILGFSATVFNLFFVNLVTVGLHSYANG